MRKVEELFDVNYSEKKHAEILERLIQRKVGNDETIYIVKSDNIYVGESKKVWN